MAQDSRLAKLESKVNFLLTRVQDVSHPEDWTYLRELVESLKELGYTPTNIRELITRLDTISLLSEKTNELTKLLADFPINQYEGFYFRPDKMETKMVTLSNELGMFPFSFSDFVYGMHLNLRNGIEEGFIGNEGCSLNHAVVDDYVSLTFVGSDQRQISFRLPALKLANAPTYYPNYLTCYYVNGSSTLNFVTLSVDQHYEVTASWDSVSVNNIIMQNLITNSPVTVPWIVSTKDVLEGWDKYKESTRVQDGLNFLQRTTNNLYEESNLSANYLDVTSTSGLYALTKVNELAERSVAVHESTYTFHIDTTYTAYPILSGGALGLSSSTMNPARDTKVAAPYAQPVVYPISPTSQATYSNIWIGRTAIFNDASVIYSKNGSTAYANTTTSVFLDCGLSYDGGLAYLNLSPPNPMTFPVTRTNEGVQTALLGNMFVRYNDPIITAMEDATITMLNSGNTHNPAFVYFPHSLTCNNLASRVYIRTLEATGKLGLLLNSSQTIHTNEPTTITMSKKFTLKYTPELIIDIPVPDLVPTSSSFTIDVNITFDDVSYTTMTFQAGTHVDAYGTPFNGYRATITTLEKTEDITLTSSHTDDSYETTSIAPISVHVASNGSNATTVQTLNNSEVIWPAVTHDGSDYSGSYTYGQFRNFAFYQADQVPNHFSNSNVTSYIPVFQISGMSPFVRRGRGGSGPDDMVVRRYPSNSTCIAQSYVIGDQYPTGGVVGGNRFFCAPSYLPHFSNPSNFRVVALNVSSGFGPRTSGITQSQLALTPIMTSWPVSDFVPLSQDTAGAYCVLPREQPIVPTSVYINNAVPADILGTWSGVLTITATSTVEEILLPKGLTGLGLIDERFSQVENLLLLFNSLFSDILARIENLEARAEFMQGQIDNIQKVVSDIVNALNTQPTQSTLGTVSGIMSLFGNIISVFLPLVGTFVSVAGLVLSGIDKIQSGDVLNGAIELTLGVIFSLYGGKKLFQRLNRKYNFSLPGVWKQTVAVAKMGFLLGTRFANRRIGPGNRGAKLNSNSSIISTAYSTKTSGTNLKATCKLLVTPSWYKLHQWVHGLPSLRLRTVDNTANAFLQTRNITLNWTLEGVGTVESDDVNLTRSVHGTLENIHMTAQEYWDEVCTQTASSTTVNLPIISAILNGDINAQFMDVIPSNILTTLEATKLSNVAGGTTDTSTVNQLERHFRTDSLQFKAPINSYVALLDVIKTFATQEDVFLELDLE